MHLLLGYNINATPESSLPGSSKTLSNTPSKESEERIQVDMNEEQSLSMPDPTPQKRKG